MDWTAGYASDILYVNAYHQDQNPSHLNLACVLNAVEPVRLDRPFTYFELGFGRGQTVTSLAAVYPQGRFYANDFNPAQVVSARETAEAAELANLTLLENSFEELVSGAVSDLPQFDFITLHGIYTWVNDENRRHIVDFIARHLKPGGMVMVSYNALPGWSPAAPMQRLLFELAELQPGRSDERLKVAVETVDKMIATGGGYFAQTTNAVLAKRLEDLKTAKPGYLVHEYLHEHWRAFYHADVARAMEPAKLQFAASADFLDAFPATFFSAEKLALLDGIADPVVRETARDYFVGAIFRKDIYVRGKRACAPARHAKLIGELSVALLTARANIGKELNIGRGKVPMKEEVYGPLLDALAVRPHTVAELAKLPGIAGWTLSRAMEAAAMLAVAGKAAMYDAGAQTDTLPARRLNRVTSLQSLATGDDYTFLAAPHFGRAVAEDYFGRLLFLAMTDAPAGAGLDELARKAWMLLKSHGRAMTQNGAKLQTDEENVAALRERLQGYIEQRVPVWKTAGIL